MAGYHRSPPAHDVGDSAGWYFHRIYADFPETDQHSDHGEAKPTPAKSEYQKRLEILLVLKEPVKAKSKKHGLTQPGQAGTKKFGEELRPLYAKIAVNQIFLPLKRVLKALQALRGEHSVGLSFVPPFQRVKVFRLLPIILWKIGKFEQKYLEGSRYRVRIIQKVRDGRGQKSEWEVLDYTLVLHLTFVK